ncbi:MAG: YkuS family protein [Bacillota bacterium]
MHEGRIAVEQGLKAVSQRLSHSGFEITAIPAIGANIPADVDAVVITGGDADMMGGHDVRFSVPVIDATGMDPDEVVHAVRQRLEVIGGS